MVLLNKIEERFMPKETDFKRLTTKFNQLNVFFPKECISICRKSI